MKQEFVCACGQKEWTIVQTSLDNGHITCLCCDTRLVFELVTIEYSV